MRSLTFNLLSGGGGVVPVVIGSANLPQGLLISGSAADCGDTGSGDFSACTGGSGTAYADSSFPSCAPCPVTFGIQRIYNDKANLGTHFLQFTAVLKGCLHALGSSCLNGAQTITQTFTIDRPSPTSPIAFSIAIDKGTLPVDDLALDAGSLALKGSSDQTTSGPAGATYNWFRLPARCGNTNASATANSAASSVTVVRSFEIKGCADLTLTNSRPTLTFGQTSLLSGVLTDYDNAHAPMPSQTITLRQCPVGKACSTRSTTTDANGRYAFTVKPVATTAYTVTHPFDGTHPAVALPATVKVKPLVTIKASVLKIRSGGSVKLTGAVKPAHAGKTVVIQRKVAGVWKKIATATLTPRSLYAKVVVLKGSRGSRALLRVVLPAHSDHLAGTSRTVTITFV